MGCLFPKPDPSILLTEKSPTSGKDSNIPNTKHNEPNGNRKFVFFFVNKYL